VIGYVRRLEHGEVAEVACGDHSDMPIFLHLIDWIERVHGVSISLTSKSNSVHNDMKQQQINTDWTLKSVHRAGFE